MKKCFLRYSIVFNNKTSPDSRTVKNQVVTENIIAVTTEQLAQKTKEIYQRVITSKKVLETYLEPLMNEGYIDKAGSDIDHRFNIYYPLVSSTKTFDYSSNSLSNNISQKVVVENNILYSDKKHIISKMEEVSRYSIQKGLRTVIKTHDWKDITRDELVDMYYSNPEDYFELTKTSDSCRYSGSSYNSDITNHYYSYLITRKTMFRTPSQIEYFQNDEIASESQEKSGDNTKSTSLQAETENILFDQPLIEQSNIKSPYESFIQKECFQSTGEPYYRCKTHPNIWHTDLAQIEGHCKNEHRD
jgi:hypothetical protein